MDIWKETKFACRLLMKSPSFTLAAVVPLALGIGANTAMFSVADALIRKPLSFPGLDRIVMLFQTTADHKDDLSALNPADYSDLNRSNSSLERLAAFREQSVTLTEGDLPKRVSAAEVSPEFFGLLGARPLEGRTIGAANGDRRQAVVSYGFWRNELGAEPGWVGRPVHLGGKEFTVIGIMRKEFQFPLGTDLWIPLPDEARLAYDRSSHSLGAVGRLRGGVTQKEWEAELAVASKRLENAHPEAGRGWAFRSLPLSQFITGGLTSQYVLMVCGGVIFVLLIACSNVANLLLARGAARRKELAIRKALGASRWQTVRLLLLESILLAIIAAALSLGLANISLGLIRSNMPAGIAHFVAGFEAISLDRTALLFALLIAVASGLISGIIPAFQTSQVDVNSVLKEGGRSGDGASGTRRVRGFLLSAEIAFAMVLLVGASLMIKGVRSLSDVVPGSQPERLLTFRLDLAVTKYPDLASCRRFFGRVTDQLGTLPQAGTVAVATNIPYGGEGSTSTISPEGAAPVRPGERRTARTECVSAAYFDAVRIALKAGRGFNAGDGVGARQVAILSASSAARFWPNTDPLGRRFRVEGAGWDDWFTVVGVVADVRYNWLDQATTPAVYLNYEQVPRRAAFVVVRAHPRELARAAHARLRDLDPSQPVESPRGWDSVISSSLIGLSYVAVMMTVLGVVALSLAAFGLYGLMSYNIRVQRADIGVRMALGASPASILRFVVGRAAFLSSMGIAAGIPCAALASYLVRQLIAGVAPLEWTAYALPAVVLFSVGVLSAYAPAISALRTNPGEVLRY